VTSSEEDTSSEDGSSSSSDGSDSDSSSSSSGSEKGGAKGASRFLMGSSESESEDERRVVRSAKDKATRELEATCAELRNKMHINDWAAIQAAWDRAGKQLERARKVTGMLGVPRAYVKISVELDDFLNKTLAGESSGARVWGERCLFSLSPCRRARGLRASPVAVSPFPPFSNNKKGQNVFCCGLGTNYTGVGRI
jgi:hypothetical protein